MVSKVEKLYSWDGQSDWKRGWNPLQSASISCVFLLKHSFTVEFLWHPPFRVGGKRNHPKRHIPGEGTRERDRSREERGELKEGGERVEKERERERQPSFYLKHESRLYYSVSSLQSTKLQSPLFKRRNLGEQNRAHLKNVFTVLKDQRRYSLHSYPNMDYMKLFKPFTDPCKKTYP